MRQLALLALLLVPALHAQVQNGGFARTDAQRQPLDWRVGDVVKQEVAVVPDQGPEGGPALQVMVGNTHQNQGEVTQSLKLEPHTEYILDGWARSTQDGLGFFQIKLYRNRKELQRISSGSSAAVWRHLQQQFNTGEADAVDLLCRYSQAKRALGQTVWFAKVGILKAPPPTLGEVSATATFEAIGVRVPWSAMAGPRDRMAIRYRPTGTADWRLGLPLFFCPTDREFRGSLVGLQPDTAYEIECWFEEHPEKRVQTAATTWSEEIPVGEVRTLPPGTSHEPLLIRDQGKPDAWIVYRSAPTTQSVLDIGQTATRAVVFDQAAYVMVEGLVIRGGAQTAVQVWDSHHIRVRGCDISGWGDPGIRKEGQPKGLYFTPEGNPINYHCGVHVAGGSRQVVVERNFIHGQRGTANSWQYGHPYGPQGIVLDRTGGNNVVRHNDIVGSETNWWNDAIESIQNGSVNGGPYQDTDLYGNVLAFSNDDGTELDGGQINVRFHHNWICWALCGVSHAPNCSGPSYDYRNLISSLGEERQSSGSAFKMGGNRLSPGMNVIVHNTIYGTGGGLRSVGYGEGPDRGAYIAFSRNNLFAGPGNGDLSNVSKDLRNDFDYDHAGRGGITLGFPGEEHAVTAKPSFVSADQGDLCLAPGSPGIDQACLLPGFNDDFTGAAPDTGAIESGSLPDGCFPPRPGGMSAMPMHTQLRHRTGQATSQVISLRAPRALGARWTATVNAPWLRCEPSSGETSDSVQEIHVGPVAELSEQRLHRGAVTFRTDGGYSRTVMLDVKVYPGEDVTLTLEAEAGTLAGGFLKVADTQASGGFYLHAPEAQIPAEGVGHEQSQPGTATYTFQIPTDGTYYLLGQCFVLGPREFAVRHDSFFCSLDDGEQARWDLSSIPYDQWTWTSAKEQGKGRLAFALKAGKHTLVIHSREPLARLDRLALTTNPYPEPPQE